MRIYIPILLLTPLCGCVTASTVKPENSAAVQGYSCEILEQKITQNGAVRDKSAQNQNMGSSKEVAARVLMPFGAAVAPLNHMNAVGNEKKYNAVLASYYKAWDDKGCSQWLYEKNKISNEKSK
jgi:hypothetical protein